MFIYLFMYIYTHIYNFHSLWAFKSLFSIFHVEQKPSFPHFPVAVVPGADHLVFEQRRGGGSMGSLRALRALRRALCVFEASVTGSRGTQTWHPRKRMIVNWELRVVSPNFQTQTWLKLETGEVGRCENQPCWVEWSENEEKTSAGEKWFDQKCWTNLSSSLFDSRM